MSTGTDHDHSEDLVRRVEQMLGRRVPADSEAWSCAVESLDYAAEAQEYFDRAEALPPGEEQTEILQEAHDAMRLAASWEERALELAAGGQ